MDSGAPGDPWGPQIFERVGLEVSETRGLKQQPGLSFYFLSPTKAPCNCKSRHFHQPTSTGWFSKLFNYLPIKVVFPFLLGAGKFRPQIQVSTGFVSLKEPLPRFQRLVPSELILDLVKAWGREIT